MTSTVMPGGTSLGFVHRAFIDGEKTGTAFDNYGGEDRFWLGPEAGKFGLFFAPGKPFTFDEWQTPHAMQEDDWTIVKHTPESIELTHAIHVTNASGTIFDVDVVRTVTLLDKPEPELAPRRRAHSGPGVGRVRDVEPDRQRRHRAVDGGQGPPVDLDPRDVRPRDRRANRHPARPEGRRAAA